MSAPKPTRPGWWWTGGNRCPIEIANIGTIYADAGKPIRDEMSLWVAGDSRWRGPVADAPPGFFIAPIPSPAVCAALARYAEALLASHADSTNASYRGESEDHFFARTSAQQALVDVILAERDGAA